MSRLAPTATHKIALGLILAIVLVGGVLRAGSIGSNTHLSADENGYVGNANRILAHERYATFKWPPGTSLAFAAATRLSGHRSLRLTQHASGPAQYVQLLAGVLTLLLMAAVAWWAAGPWAGVLAVALGATYWPLVVATRTFLSEPLGGLALLATVAAAVLARSRLQQQRWWLALIAAGVVGGLACLTRGDIAVGMAVIALALALSGRPGWRVGALRAGIYLGAILLTLTPWLLYAAGKEGRFVPITTAGPDAFFIGSYLPGKGALVPTEEKLAPEVCKHFPEDCGRYWQKSAAPLFRLIRARYPGKSADAAVKQADLENIRKYALGQPVAFTGMLWGKFWKMWKTVWSGGNGTYNPSTSQLQHTLYVLLAWVGLLGAAFATRRWELIVTTAVLLAIAGLATLFNDQPRYNVSLMPLLLAYGSAGLWLLGGWIRKRSESRRGATLAAPISPLSSSVGPGRAAPVPEGAPTTRSMAPAGAVSGVIV
jgi:4-amino-4-deoxy-L-arabinose transferase-like glycosyltransferase